MKSVRYFTLSLNNDEQKVNLRSSGKILAARVIPDNDDSPDVYSARGDYVMCIWYIYDTVAPQRSFTFRLITTGEHVDNIDDMRHVETIIGHHKTLHLFEVKDI